jgi:nicotinamide riboside kinase
MSRVLRIAVIGAECTGKTTLCRELAQALGGLWVPEYLREFVDRAGRTPLAHEQAALMAEQVAREAAAVDAARHAGQPLVAFDSVPLVTALYSRFYFTDDALLAAATAHHRHYDLTLVTDIDLPWEADGLLRDGPDVRARFHALLLDWLSAAGIEHTLVAGRDVERVAQALAPTRARLAPLGPARDSSRG